MAPRPDALHHQQVQADSETIACELLIKKTNAIILHGAGQANRTRYYTMATELLSHNVGVVLFDFPGHGESTGDLATLSIDRRDKLARNIIEQLVPADSPLYLIGFSMSAQTVCDLLPVLGERVQTILLGCPAMYAEEARTLPFGSDAFTTILRGEDSWRRSSAPSKLRGFTGKTIIAIGDKDEVIPPGVVDALKQAAQQLTFRQYHQADHQLAKWLTQHPAALSELIGQLIK